MVLLPAAIATGVLPLLLAAARLVTAAGATLSTITVADVVPLTLPAASVTVTLSEWLPCVNTAVV